MDNVHKSPHKMKKRKTVGKDEAVSPRQAPEGDSIRRKSLGFKKGKKLMDSEEENVVPSPKKKTARKSTSPATSPGMPSGGSKDGIKKRKKSGDSWERAVQAARGFPDGKSVESLNSASQEENVSQKKTVKGKFEKGKTKAIHVVQGAAKVMKNKFLAESRTGQKAVKRKRNDSGGEGDLKKQKLDGLTRKEKKKQRKMMKNNYELTVELKKLWEDSRRHDLASEKRQKLTGDMCSLVKGKVKELIFAHDTSRVVQHLLKTATPAQRTDLFEEIKDSILEMCKLPYAKFCVHTLIKYGTKSQRNLISRSFQGQVKKLVRHKHAADVVEFLYNNCANASQRALMLEEFYGPSFALFKTYELRTLDDIMKSDPDKRDSILSNMKETMAVLVDKEVLAHSMVHKLFLQFFTYATDKYRPDMIETLRESLVHMVHTRDGARVAMHCLWFGTAKDRKVIIKSMKPYVSKICVEECGHLVLLALFDVVDDTKLVQKAIIEEMMKSVQDIARDQYGLKVLLYLLSARDPLHFHPDVVKVLQLGDHNTTSKKEASVRRSELLDAASAPLLKFLEDNCKELVMKNSTMLLILTILKCATGDQTNAMRAVAEIAAEPFDAGSLENFHIVEHPAGHMTLKRIIAGDAERMKKEDAVLFSKVLLDLLPEGALQSWAACNRGCFILVHLLEVNHPEVSARVTEQMSGIKTSLCKMDFKGAHILLNKMNNG